MFTKVYPRYSTAFGCQYLFSLLLAVIVSQTFLIFDNLRSFWEGWSGLFFFFFFIFFPLSTLLTDFDHSQWVLFPQCKFRDVAGLAVTSLRWTQCPHYQISFARSLKKPLWYKGFPGDSDGKVSACNAGDPGSIPGSGRYPGEGNGNPLQYSCLENSVDWGAW